MVMDVEKIFHMSEGAGKTSYSTNSSLQKKAAGKVKHITLESIEQVYLDTKPKSISIADLGCSSGPNTLSNLKDIVQSIQGICRENLHPVPEFRLFLNDLPSNDFNIIFRAIPDFLQKLRDGRNEGAIPAVYVGGYPGSFYGRLFPDNSLHFVYSSYSLHWLSKVPPGVYDENGKSINKGSIYISKQSPPQVAKAYFSQFQQDFSLFLGSRSEEIVSGGQMVLILLGREDGPAAHTHTGRNSLYWDILTRSFSYLVAKGVVSEEKLDSYEVHFYAPSKLEIEDCIEKENSFKLEKLEIFNVEKDASNCSSYGSKVAMTVRAIQESMISHHFGEEILDDLFEIFARLVDEEIAKEDIINPITFVLVLKKL